jgi:protein tyrosine/serine phosphatase
VTSLVWEGCLNVRDLGGLPAGGGAVTCGGSVIRADNVRRLTDSGWRALASHGVVRIVDLRWATEKEGEPPPGVDIEVVDVPVLGDGFDEEYIRELDEHLDGVDDVADHYAWSYVDFLERYRERFGLAVAAIAEAEGPVVVHCVGGRDRTGLVSALILRLAGVEPSVVAADYAASEVNLAPRWESWIASEEDEVGRARMRKLMHTPAEAMVAVLAEIERRYGDVRGYLLAAGVTDAQLERLRARLVASSH